MPAPIVKSISPARLKERLDQGEELFVLDVRTEEEWGLHHIPCATLIPMPYVAQSVPLLPRDQEIVVVCEHGVRSHVVARYLAEEAGFENVVNMLGGMSVWEGEIAEGA